MIEGSRVLLTGGGGSVGRVLIPRLLNEDPTVLRIFDNNEPALARLKSQFGDKDACRFLSGDIRDRDRLDRAVENIDIVIHTAAMKHVDICEYNPFEAVKTNTLGLQNVVDAAIDSTVRRLVFTSSDKAVNPANTMGTTKLLGEQLITAGNKHSGRSDLRLTSVRFGNVLGSSHSVVPAFERQIRAGGPLELTDRRMTRFFLTHDGLFDLVSGAIEHTGGGDVFLAKMPAVRIEELAEAMVDVLAPRYGHAPADVDIDVVGRRPGETFHEEIMTEREADRALETDSLYAIPPETGSYLSYESPRPFDDADEVRRSSAGAETLSTADIESLLEDSGVLEAK